MSRRDLLKFAAVTPVGLGGLAATGIAKASADSLGLLLDYAAGVLSAADLKAAGAVGAIRYVSDRRPGASWMLGKPIQISEVHQYEIDARKVAGVGVDLNSILKPQFGQWD